MKKANEEICTLVVAALFRAHMDDLGLDFLPFLV